MEVLHSAPTTSSFTPLPTHQSQTPDSFFDGPPILYHHSPSATLKTHASDLAAAPALSVLARGVHRHSNGTAAINETTEDEDQHDEEIEIQGVDVWVTSEFVFPIPSPRSTPLHKTDNTISTSDVSSSTPPPKTPASQSPTPPSPSTPSNPTPPASSSNS